MVQSAVGSPIGILRWSTMEIVGSLRRFQSTMAVRHAQQSKAGGGGPTSGRVVSFRGGSRGQGGWQADGVEQLENVIKWIGNFETVTMRPEMMRPAIYAVGKALTDVWDGEGDPHWQGLSAQTRMLREKRGYTPASPILHQSGGLRQASLVPLAGGWTGNAKVGNVGAAYEGSDATLYSARLLPRMFAMTIRGDKVGNQTGTRIRNELGQFAGADEITREDHENYVPARPFFYIPYNIEEYGMTQKTIQNIEYEWATSVRGVAEYVGQRPTTPLATIYTSGAVRYPSYGPSMRPVGKTQVMKARGSQPYYNVNE